MFIIYDFQDDNHFFELKDMEIMKERIDTLNTVNEFVGTYYSVEYVRRYILQQSDTEIAEIDKQIEDEKKKGVMGQDAGAEPGEPTGMMPGMGIPGMGAGPNGSNVPGGDEYQSSRDQEYTDPDF